MGRKRRPKPIYALTIQLRQSIPKSPSTQGEDSEDAFSNVIELSIAGLRPKDKISTIKELIERKYEIPRSHQVLLGPLPDRREAPDPATLRRLDFILGRYHEPSASRNRSQELDNRTAAASPGVLFSSVEPQPEPPASSELAAAGTDPGDRAPTPRLLCKGDRLELVTLRPAEDYAKGGAFYQEQQWRRRVWWGAGIALAAALLAVMGYVLWLVPSYRMPRPTHWLGDLEQHLQRQALRRRLEAMGLNMTEEESVEAESAESNAHTEL